MARSREYICKLEINTNRFVFLLSFDVVTYGTLKHPWITFSIIPCIDNLYTLTTAWMLKFHCYQCFNKNIVPQKLTSYAIQLDESLQFKSGKTQGFTGNLHFVFFLQMQSYSVWYSIGFDYRSINFASPIDKRYCGSFHQIHIHNLMLVILLQLSKRSICFLTDGCGVKCVKE